MPGLIRFDQLRISSTVANAALEGYTDGTLGESSLRVAVSATNAGLERHTDGLRIAAAAAGAGLTGGGGAALAVNTDGTTIEVVSDAVRIAASAAGAGLTGGGGAALAVGAGTGITVNADDVAINTSSTVTFQGAASWDFRTNSATLLVKQPTADGHAASKLYVDNVASGLSVKSAVRAATTGALANSPTYNNGTGGVGATLTAGSNGAFPAQDGVTLVQNDRLLVKDQATAAHNGIYTLTTVGDGSNPYVLTRATDFDNSPSGEVEGGDFVFVQEGTTLADTGWVLTTDGTVTIGTTALNWTQFSSAGVVTASTGLEKIGNDIRLDLDGSGGGVTFTSGANWVFPADSLDITGTPTQANAAVNKSYVDARTLNQVYDDGGSGTITTNATDGALIIAGTESLTVTATGGLIVGTGGGSERPVDLNATTVDVDATGAVTIDASGASHFRATGAALVLGTVTSGATTVSSAGDVFILTSSGGNEINISNNAVAATVRLGTGGAAKTVQVGSTNSTSSLTLQTGTGALTVTAGGIFDLNGTGAVTIDSSGGQIKVGADAVNQDMEFGTGGVRQNTIGGTSAGNRTYIQSNRLTINSKVLYAASPYQILGDNYHADAAQQGGLVVNYDPTTTTTTLSSDAGQTFQAFVASTSLPRIYVTAANGFAAGDLILVSVTGGTPPNVRNNGLYEVHAINTTGTHYLELKSTGSGVAGAGRVEGFTIDDVAAIGVQSGSVTKVNVAVWRAQASSGDWQFAKGATVPLTYTTVKADTTSTGNVASVIDWDADGIAVRVDNSTIEGSGAAGSLRVKDAGITSAKLAASVAGDGLTGGAGSPLAVGAGNGITVSADAVAVNADTTGTGNIATVVSVTSNGVGVRVDDSTIEDDGAGATAVLRVKDSGITTAKINNSAVTTAKINDDAVTGVKLGVSFREENVDASSFSNTNPSTYTLAKTPLTGTKFDFYHIVYRNGVADMTNVGSGGTADTANKFKISGSTLTIGANINGSSNTYKVRYLSSDLTV